MPAPSELSGSRVQSELSGSRVSSGSQVPPGTVQEARRAFSKGTMRRRSSAASSSTGAASPYARAQSKPPTPTGSKSPLASPRMAPPEPPTPPRPAVLQDVCPEVPQFDMHGGALRTPTEAGEQSDFCSLPSPDRTITVQEEGTGRLRKIAQPLSAPQSPERERPRHPRTGMDVQEGVLTPVEPAEQREDNPKRSRAGPLALTN